MTWFADKLGPNPAAARNSANGASRSAPPPQAQKGGAQKSTPQRAAAPAPAPEPDKKKKKGWF